MTDNRKRKVQTMIYKTLQKKTQNRAEIKRSRMISSSCSTYSIHYNCVSKGFDLLFILFFSDFFACDVESIQVGLISHFAFITVVST
jgi:hypothetical protein